MEFQEEAPSRLHEVVRVVMESTQGGKLGGSHDDCLELC